MDLYSDQHRGSRFGSAAFTGLVVALVAVVFLKILLGLTFGASLVVACVVFFLAGTVSLRRSTR